MHLKNMFKPEDETEPDWDKDLAEDVKGECEGKYGKVERIKVVRDSQVRITRTLSYIHWANTTSYRAISSSSSTQSLMLARLSMVSTAVGSAANPSRPPSCPTPSCRLICNLRTYRLQAPSQMTLLNAVVENRILKHPRVLICF